MFFYTTLLIASVIVAIVVLWLYNAILDAGRVVYRAMLPSSKDAPTDHLGIRTMRTTINDTPMPWGWKSDKTPRRAARVHYKVTRKVKPGRSKLKTASKPWGW